jgi:hypothetical protein
MPVEAQLLVAMDRIVGALGIFDRPLVAETLMRAAQRRTRLKDFGVANFQEPLELLLRDYDQSANLSLFGRISARWDMLRYLTNLLLLREAEREQPAILELPIEKPLFVIGMPRSGTSFMHYLLAQDPNHLVLRCWEAIYPTAGRGMVRSRPSSRARAVDRRLSWFARLAPELLGMHPMSADSPQECTEIMGHVFRSMRFDTTHEVPAYHRWLQGARLLPAYEFHKRFLKHLQYRRTPGRWVLKSPDHVFALDSIRKVYPDAGLVFMHRDPMRVLPSVARLTEVLRRPFTRSVDRLAIGRQVTASWIRGATILREASAEPAPCGLPILHIHFKQFIQDPLATVAQVYEHFGWALTSEQSARLNTVIATRRNGGYSRHEYRLKDYGVDRGTTALAFRDYMEHFGIEAEPEV